MDDKHPSRELVEALAAVDPAEAPEPAEELARRLAEELESLGPAEDVEET